MDYWLTKERALTYFIPISNAAFISSQDPSGKVDPTPTKNWRLLIGIKHSFLIIKGASKVRSLLLPERPHLSTTLPG